jgi:hypothetical protein
MRAWRDSQPAADADDVVRRSIARAAAGHRQLTRLRQYVSWGAAVPPQNGRSPTDHAPYGF